MFGISFVSKNNIIIDETYLNMKINQYNKIGKEYTLKTYSFVNWNYSHFSQISQTLLQEMNITNYYCPESNDLMLLANSFSDKFAYFDLKIKRCTGTDSKGNPWKNESEIDTALDSTFVQLAIINNYFDFNDYSMPIKSYLSDELYYELVSGFTKRIDINIRQNTAEQKDSIFRYEPYGIQSSFISFDTVYEKFYRVNQDKLVLAISFYKDSKSTEYQRSVFSFLDCCGLIGGANEILNVSGKLI